MKKQLAEINFLRPIVIVLLVLMHSFTMYGGGWSLAPNIHDVRVYFWVAKASYSCMLETFVFISGYLFAFQTFELKKNFTFKKVVISKLKRLILPSIIFSILYTLLFFKIDFLSLKYYYTILNGVGHLWFLPMLFWCFCFTYFIYKIQIKEEIKLICLFLLSIISPGAALPLQLGNTCYYLFFFYLGAYLLKHKEIILSKFTNNKSIIFFSILFIVTFICLTLFRECLSSIQISELSEKLLNHSIMNFVRLIYSTLGLFVLFIISLRYTSKNILSSKTIAFNKLCFGVYLYQQFFLIALYYHTNAPQIFGSYLLPVVGFISALFLSILFSYLTRQTKIGRYLIG